MTQLANGWTARTNRQVAGIPGNVDTIIINSPTALENEDPRPDRSTRVDDINHDWQRLDSDWKNLPMSVKTTDTCEVDSEKGNGNDGSLIEK